MHVQSPIRLLVVDDEPAMRRALRNSLTGIGYEVEEAGSGEAALAALRRQPAAVVLLDVNMPGIGGMETCRRIRQDLPETGIIVISVREKEDDKVQAFEAGADDYVTKPFRFRELLARLQAVRRRTRADEGPAPVVLRTGDLELDLTNRLFRKQGRELRLSRKEFDILACLMRRPGAAIPHSRLLQAVWGPEYGNETEYLRTYIRHLRRKIEKDAAHPEYIVTEPWVGYRLLDPLCCSDAPSEAA